MTRDARPRARAAVGLLVAGWLVLGGAVGAAAHTQFLGSDPQEGSVLQELPAEVTFEYSDAVSPEFVVAAVAAPGEEPAEVPAEAEGSVVRIPVAGAATPTDGQWQVVVRVVSTDGHPVEHTLTFELTGAAGAGPPTGPPTAPSVPGTPAAEPSPVPSAAEPGTTSADPLAQAGAGAGPLGAVLVGLVAVAGVAAVVVHLRRRP